MCYKSEEFESLDELEKCYAYLLENGIDMNRYMESDDFDGLLLAIDDVIVEDIVNNNDEPTGFGIQMQKVYDTIFNLYQEPF